MPLFGCFSGYSVFKFDAVSHIAPPFWGIICEKLKIRNMTKKEQDNLLFVVNLCSCVINNAFFYGIKISIICQSCHLTVFAGIIFAVFAKNFRCLQNFIIALLCHCFGHVLLLSFVILTVEWLIRSRDEISAAICKTEYKKIIWKKYFSEKNIFPFLFGRHIFSCQN